MTTGLTFLKTEQFKDGKTENEMWGMRVSTYNSTLQTEAQTHAT